MGFALEEPARLARRAHEKLTRKGLTAIVANPLETMSAEDIAAIVYTADGNVLLPESDSPGPPANPEPVRLPKPEFARWLINTLDRIY